MQQETEKPDGVEMCQRLALKRVIQFFKSFAATCILLAVVVMWVAEAELLQVLQTSDSYNKAYFINWVITSGYSSFFIIWCLWFAFAYWRRSPLLVRYTSRTFWRRYALIILPFTTLYVAGGYTWMLSNSRTSVAANTAIYNSNFAFVFLLSVPVLREKMSVIKGACLAIGMTGVVLIAITPSNIPDTHGGGTPLGYVMVVVATMLGAVYDVMYKRFGVVASDVGPVSYTVESLLFMGSMGVVALVLFWPGIFVEGYEAPSSNTLIYLVVNSLLDCTVNFLLNLGILLSSPLYIAMGTLLTIPVTIVYAGLSYGTWLAPLACGGAACVAVGFIALHVYTVVKERQVLTPATAPVTEEQLPLRGDGASQLARVN